VLSAPQTVYQGSKQMRPVAGGKDRQAARKTIAGKGVKVKRVKSQTPMAGSDLNG